MSDRPHLVTDPRPLGADPDDDRRYPNAADAEAQNDWLDTRDMLDTREDWFYDTDY